MALSRLDTATLPSIAGGLFVRGTKEFYHSSLLSQKCHLIFSLSPIIKGRQLNSRPSIKVTHKGIGHQLTGFVQGCITGIASNDIKIGPRCSGRSRRCRSRRRGGSRSCSTSRWIGRTGRSWKSRLTSRKGLLGRISRDGGNRSRS